jgi:peptidoglycan hydrolase-like protein with peptidoglycan-binding domain
MRTFIGGLMLALIATCFATGAAQAQTTGTLSIGSKFVEGNCLESKDTDGSIVINKCSAGASQALRYDDETGQIRQGDKCLAAPTKGQPLVVVPCADVAEQKWNFTETGAIKSDSGLCADILNFWRDPGTAVIAWDCTGTDNQKFFATNVRKPAGTPATDVAAAPAVLPVKGQTVIGSYFLQGKCLNVLTNRASVTVDNCTGEANQAFHFVSGVSGQIAQGDKCLASDAKGQPLVVEACDTSAGQDWTFAADGSLRNRDNICADIFAFGTRAGTNIIAWDCTGTDNQKWYPALAAASGSFSLGKQLAATLREDSATTTVSMSPGYSAYNLTGAGGKAISADAKDNITGGQNGIIIVGGAGVMTVRFLKGLAAPSVKTAAPGTSILPKDWGFFSGATAGSLVPM